MRTEVAYARGLFKQGLPLIGMVNRELALDLDLFSRGGMEILRAIERRDYDVLSARPSISKLTKAGLLLRAVCAKVFPALRLGKAAFAPRLQIESGISSDLRHDGNEELDAAYAVCRAIARREAKNFYYAFVALPRPKRNAICAIYAFMRQADDLADDEAMPIEERRIRLDAWTAAWKATCAGGPTVDPVFVAVRDATARYRIPAVLLNELIAGVTMDVDAAKSGAPDTYATFNELYRYCYLVASVVGLVCIRIFGYSDPRAEKLAEETGVAFQLTNILRDVEEDAERKRVYLPLEDLAAHGVGFESVLLHKKGAGLAENERAILREIGRRAERYYASAQELMPLIDKESRPALWVLVAIYHALLKRIEAADFDVYSRRISVPAATKISILISGLTRMMWNRVAG